VTDGATVRGADGAGGESVRAPLAGSEASGERTRARGAREETVAEEGDVWGEAIEESAPPLGVWPAIRLGDRTWILLDHHGEDAPLRAGAPLPAHLREGDPMPMRFVVTPIDGPSPGVVTIVSRDEPPCVARAGRRHRMSTSCDGDPPWSERWSVAPVDCTPTGGGIVALRGDHSGVRVTDAEGYGLRLAYRESEDGEQERLLLRGRPVMDTDMPVSLGGGFVLESSSTLAVLLAGYHGYFRLFVSLDRTGSVRRSVTPNVTCGAY